MTTFKVGDRVQAKENPTVVGTIVKVFVLPDYGLLVSYDCTFAGPYRTDRRDLKHIIPA